MSKDIKRLNSMVSKLVENVRELREIIRNICKHDFAFVKVCRYTQFNYEKGINPIFIDIDYLCSICKKQMSKKLKDHCKAELDGLLKLGLITMNEYTKAVPKENKPDGSKNL